MEAALVEQAAALSIQELVEDVDISDTGKDENPFDNLPNDALIEIFNNFTYAERAYQIRLICQRFRDVVRMMTPNFFNHLPSELILRIFENFGIKERANLSLVCKRFHKLVTYEGEGMSDVYVMNVFEEHIWDNSVSRNSSKQTIIRLASSDELGHVFKYFKSMSAAKIWYESPEFARDVIDNLSESQLKMSCVDVYPYAPEEILDYLEEKLPKLEALTMRPHGAPLWNGVRMTQMPSFQYLKTLIMDGFDVEESIKFPPNVTTFEFSNRTNNSETPQWMMVMPKLAHMSHLEFLSLSHVRIATEHDFVAFIQFLGPEFLPVLRFLVLKFCKFPRLPNGIPKPVEPERLRPRYWAANRNPSPEPVEEPEPIVPEVLKDPFQPVTLPDLDGLQLSLQWLKIELCDGNLAELLSVFTKICSGLQMVLLSVIADLESLRDINTAAPILADRQIWTHLSFLTKSPINYLISKSPFRKILPAPALFGITTKIEASFADDPEFFKTYLLGGQWNRVHEVKLISCPAASNQFLEHISEHSKFLRKLTVIRCQAIDRDGMAHFVDHLQNRNRDLMITWKGDKYRMRPSGFYLHMCTKVERLEGKTMRFKTKSFPEGEGEEVVVTEKDTKRTISLRDFDDNDAGRLVSICVRTPFSIRRKEELAIEEARKQEEERAKLKLAKLEEQLRLESPPNYEPPPPPPVSNLDDTEGKQPNETTEIGRDPETPTPSNPIEGQSSLTEENEIREPENHEKTPE